MSPEAGVMGPVSCLIIQDDPPISGGQEAKYTGGLNIESCHVPGSYSPLPFSQFTRSGLGQTQPQQSSWGWLAQAPLMMMMNPTVSSVNNYITISMERGTLDWQLDTANHKYRHFGKHIYTDIVQVSHLLYLYNINIYTLYQLIDREYVLIFFY